MSQRTAGIIYTWNISFFNADIHLCFFFLCNALFRISFPYFAIFLPQVKHLRHILSNRSCTGSFPPNYLTFRCSSSSAPLPLRTSLLQHLVEASELAQHLAVTSVILKSTETSTWPKGHHYTVNWQLRASVRYCWLYVTQATIKSKTQIIESEYF